MSKLQNLEEAAHLYVHRKSQPTILRNIYSNPVFFACQCEMSKVILSNWFFVQLRNVRLINKSYAKLEGYK
jgi:hypothetical protein